MYDSRVTPFYQARELELMPLELTMENVDQLQRLPHTPCPICSEKGLILDGIDIQINNSPADCNDLRAQHTALHDGLFEISGVFEIACIFCDFGQTQFLYLSSPPEHKEGAAELAA